MRVPDESLLTAERYACDFGDAEAVHIGLRSRVQAGGYPHGYDRVVHVVAVQRLASVAEAYGLGQLTNLFQGPPERIQPVSYSALEAYFMAEQARWMPKVSIDPVVLLAADAVASVAEACAEVEGHSDELLIRYVT